MRLIELAKVPHNCIILHVHEISARGRVLSAAPVAVRVATRISHHDLDRLVVGLDANHLLGERCAVAVGGEERYQVVLLNVFKRTVSEVSKVSVPLTAVVHFAFCLVCRGVVVRLVLAAERIGNVPRPRGGLPARWARDGLGDGGRRVWRRGRW